MLIFAARQRAALAVVLSMVLALVAWVLPATALADGNPNIGLSVNQPATALYGTPATVELVASNPVGEPFAYNLSYRAVLPGGVSYVPGSASPGLGAPTIINDSPFVSQTTLLWENIADLSPNSTNTASFQVSHDPGAFAIASTFQIQAGAYVNSDPRFVPDFATDGTPIPGPSSYTGFATGTDITEITAIEIRKSEPSPEGELLRGIHDHQTNYTLTYRNNAVDPTDNLVIDDYLPANLEFLGCGGPGADHTTDAPTNPGSAEEYPGSGPIVVPAVAGCASPTLVETVSIDPDGPGPLAAGVYTHVQWAGLGSLAPGASQTITYRAAIPIRANTLTFTNGTPPTTGVQSTNLDNNAGAEASDEQSLTNLATIAGDYDGNLAVTDAHAITRTAEDLAIRKSVDSGTLAEGQLSTWSLELRASEYRYATAITVTDTLPDGLCPLGASNFTQAPQDADDGQCDPTGAQPSSPYTSAVEQSNGSWQLTWTSATAPALALLQSSGTATLTFPTRTRTHYQEGFANAGPILAGDSVSNGVATTGTTNVICAGGPSDCSGAGTPIDHDGPLSETAVDASSAGQTTSLPTLRKRVASSSTNCAADAYVTTVPVYRPGDRICWELRVAFPNALNTRGLVLTDFLPGTVEYDPTLGLGAGELFTPNDTIPGTTLDNTSDITPGTPGGQLRWTLPTGGIVDPSEVFERQIATTAALPIGSASGDITSNLFKMAAQNTAGTTFPLRDSADFELAVPEVDLQKRIVGLNGSPVGPVQNQNVRGGDAVTFRVRLSNAGDLDADATETWDVLPPELTCADVSLISDAGACSGGRITWGATPQIGPTVPAGGTYDLTYVVTVPTTLEPTEAWTNTAGVRQFQSPTNQGGSFTYIPQSNIDPTLEPSANVPAADDTATLTGTPLTITKGRTSPVDGANNTIARATIGEVVHYTVTVTVPRGLTINDAAIVDPDLPSPRQPLVPGSTTATRDGVAVPGSFSIAETGGSPSLTFPASYTANTTADEAFRLEFDVTVADLASNVRGGANLSNRGRVTLDSPSGPPTSLTSAAVTTAIVEPVIGIAKGNDTGGAPVAGNDLVTYTVTLRNGSAGTPSSPASNGTVSPAHGTTLVDVVPSGVTPIDGSDNPLADGDVTASGGAWSAGARTLTWTPAATIEAGATAAFSYRVRVNDPAIGGSALTNTASTTTTSLAGTVAGERTTNTGTSTGYAASTTNTLTVETASITKTADRTTLTIGDPVVYTSDVTLPAQVELFDTTVTDTLPDSIDFDGYTSATCVSGCPPETPPTVQNYTPNVNGSGTTTIAWSFGDLTPTATQRVVRLVYRGHLRATHRSGGGNVASGETSVNSITVASNQTNTVGAFDPAVIPPAGGFDDLSTPATHTLTVQEPAITLDKALAIGAGAYGDGPTPVQDGDALRYRIVVRNTGNSPLYDVTVNDAPDTELTAVSLTTNAGLNTDGWSALDPAMRWVIPGPIAPGASVTLGYDASLIAITGLTNGQLVDNTATAPAGFGVPEAQRLSDGFVYRSYAATPDAVQAVVRTPTISLAKTTGAAGNPDSAPAEVGQAFTWRVVVTNTSASAAATSLAVRDVLPRDWDYIAGSSAFAPGGAVEPTVTPQATGDELDWATSIALAPGASTTLTFQARPTLAAATSIGTGAGSPHVNTASATVRNVAGNPADANGPFTSGTDTASGILAIPTLTIAKTPDGGSAAAGDTVNFHVVVTNTGAVGATGVVVTDTLPPGTTYVPGSATAAPSAGFSETAVSAGAVEWAIASLAAGASVDITVPVETDPSATSGTNLVNSATAIANETPTPVTNPGDVTLTTSADLSASKAATPNPATAGQTLTYTLGVHNDGPSDAQGVVLTDTLPPTVTFVSASAGCAEAAGTVTCTVGRLAAGGDATATIVVTVNAGTTTNADNTVSVTGTTPDPDPANNTAGTTVPVGTDYDLSVVKTAVDPVILRGGTGTFRLAVNNAGPSTATGVLITDVLPAGLTYVSDDRGCAETAGTITCALGTMGPGANEIIEIVVRGAVVGTHPNTATVSATGSATADRDHTNDTSTAPITVIPSADLRLEKTGPAAVAAGGLITYSLTVTNDGPDDATGVVIDDQLPAGTTFEGGDPGCAASGTTPPTVQCTIGALAVGDAETREIRVRVPVGLGATALTNTATTSGNEGDLTPPNNTDTAITQVGPAADLAITKVGPARADAGGTLTWTLVVTNNGPSTATDVTLADPLPAGVTLVGSASSQGTCVDLGGTAVRCDLGTMAVGDAVQVTITVNLPTALAGTTVTNTASVTGTEPDPQPSNNEATVQTPIDQGNAGTAALSVTKAADGGPVRVGDFLGYTITVTNNGPAASPDTVVTDALSGAVLFRSAVPEQGTCAELNGTVTCNLGTLANGQTVRVRLTVVVLSAGPLPNTATVAGPRTDRTLSDNLSDAVVQATQEPTTLAVRKWLVQRRLIAGRRASYRVKVTNTGDEVATNVQVCDQLPRALTLRSAGRGTVRNGQLCFTVDRLRPGRHRIFLVKVNVSATTQSTSIRNRASAVADNARRVNGAVSHPLVQVRGIRTTGVTG